MDLRAIQPKFKKWFDLCNPRDLKFLTEITGGGTFPIAPHGELICTNGNPKAGSEFELSDYYLGIKKGKGKVIEVLDEEQHPVYDKGIHSQI